MEGRKMSPAEVRQYYLSDSILERMFAASREREFVAAKFTPEGLRYFQRPSAVQYRTDIEEFVAKGATSFHISVERWENPAYIGKEKRKGWDLIIDIDTSPKGSIEETVEYGKVVAGSISDFLSEFSIPHGIKFSGSRGFHIFVPMSAFPRKVNFSPLEELYPFLPRILVSYIRSETAEQTRDRLVERFGMKRLLEIAGELPSDIDMEKMLNIGIYSPDLYAEASSVSDFQMGKVADAEKEWGERHLFRAPFSLNEKTWLASVPVSRKELDGFSVEQAIPGNFDPMERPEFFAKGDGEGAELLVRALDWSREKMGGDEERKNPEKRVFRFDRKVPESEFPPCIKAILAGLSDGRKRSLFTLITFLKKMNWSVEEIEERLMKWNEANEKPLSPRMIQTQLKWHERRDLMPANCYSDLFYVSIGVCRPDERCSMIKNPVNYPRMFKGKGFVCRKCGKSFKTKRGLSIHERTHKDS